MIRAVLFDLDNTLYCYDEAHAAAWRALLGYALDELGLTQERFQALHTQADRTLRMREGSCAVVHNRLIRYQLLLEAQGLPIRHAPAMSALYWGTFLDNLRLFPGTKEGLAALRQAGYRVGVGTNMTADRQFDKLERLGLYPYVDILVTSEEAGAEKPDEKLFLLCTEKLGLPASECAYVGDSWQGDVLGSRKAGMHPVWFRPDGGEAADVPVVSSLVQLPELLKSL